MNKSQKIFRCMKKTPERAKPRRPKAEAGQAPWYCLHREYKHESSGNLGQGYRRRPNSLILFAIAL